MDKLDIHFEWSEEKRDEPGYTKFSLGLQEDIKIISNSIAYIRFLLNAISEIAKNENRKELSEKYPVLSMMRHAFYYQSIIEVHKLFNKKDVYSIPKLLNELINSYKRIVWFNPLTLEYLNELKDSITENNIATLFSKIKAIRDNYLAHNKRKPENVKITIEEMEILQKKAQDISNEIGNALYGTSTGYDFQRDDSIKGIIHRLLTYEKLYTFVFNAYIDHKKTIDAEKLIEILRGRE